jgi:hypothetical protein
VRSNGLLLYWNVAVIATAATLRDRVRTREKEMRGRRFRGGRGICEMASHPWLVAGCMLCVSRLMAGELVTLDLSHEHGIYQLNLEMQLHAPYSDIRHVLTDYVHIYRLNPSIVESEVLPMPDDSVVRIRTLINYCVLVFCREILRVEDVRELDTGTIYSTIVPRLSNVKSGVSLWQIQARDGYTRLNYDMTLEPGFYVPPLIGTWFVKQKLKKEVLLTFGNIERLAQIRAGQSDLPQEQILTGFSAESEGEN